MSERFVHPLEVREVIRLCDRLGFGRVMQIAADEWAKRDPVGALTVGPAVCYAEDTGEREAYCMADVALIRAESVLSLIRYRGPNPPVPGPMRGKNASPDLTRDDLDAVLAAVREARKRIADLER